MVNPIQQFNGLPQMLGSILQPSNETSIGGNSFQNTLNQVIALNNLQQANLPKVIPSNIANPMAADNALRSIQNAETLVAQLLNDDVIDPLQEDEPGSPFILSSDNLEEEGFSSSHLEVTPFQFFLDKALDFFLNVSGMERRADQLMERFARGDMSIEEMTIEKAKVGVAISFSITLVNQVTQVFKDIQNMQI